MRTMLQSRRFARVILCLLAAVVGSVSLASPASAQVGQPGDVIYHTVWKVTSVSGAYQTASGWRNCTSITHLPYAYTSTCSISMGVTNTVTGTVTASTGDISAAVGFSVSVTRTIAGSATFSIPPNSGGWIQWHAVFSTKTVVQTKYLCTATGSCINQNTTATAYASNYVGPGFRYAPEAV